MSIVTIRPFEELGDSGFIYSTWPKSVYHKPAKPIKMEKSAWFGQFYFYLQAHLRSSAIYIACLKDSPDTIIGYAILEGIELQFVYIKEMYRSQGIATLLLKNKKIESVNTNNLTKAGEAILDAHPELKQIDKKEVKHEPNTKEIT